VSEERAVLFEAIAREVMEPVRRFLVRRTDHATADDVLADTLLVMWRRLDDVPESGALPWAYGIAGHCLANAQRGVRRQRRLAVRAELVRLWAWEQLTPGEIAEVLDITPNAVGIRLHRARQKLAKALQIGAGRKDKTDAGHEEWKGRRHE
jgi:RNA polymerase sigma-70 factor, ECF subfamily